MKVRYTRTAVSEIADIFSYIAQRNQNAAERVIDAVEQMVGRIAQFPRSAPLADQPGVRVAVVGRFPYLISYALD